VLAISATEAQKHRSVPVSESELLGSRPVGAFVGGAMEKLSASASQWHHPKKLRDAGPVAIDTGDGNIKSTATPLQKKPATSLCKGSLPVLRCRI